MSKIYLGENMTRRFILVLYPFNEHSFFKITNAKHSPSQTLKKVIRLLNEIPLPKTALQQYLKICTKCNNVRTICRRHYALKKSIDFLFDNSYRIERELDVRYYTYRDGSKGFFIGIRSATGFSIYIDNEEATVYLPVIHPLPRAIVYPLRKTNPNSYLFLAHAIKTFLKRVLFSI